MGSEINGGIGVGKGGKFKADGQHGKHLASVLAFIQKDSACFIGDSRYQLIDSRSFEVDRAAVIREMCIRDRSYSSACKTEISWISLLFKVVGHRVGDVGFVVHTIMIRIVVKL